jgi:hypothetical protein
MSALERTLIHVASMSRGAAGKVWEALKTNGIFWLRG